MNRMIGHRGGGGKGWNSLRAVDPMLRRDVEMIGEGNRFLN